METILKLKKGARENPQDLLIRLVLADALEEEGLVESARFERLLVGFAQDIERRVNQDRQDGQWAVRVKEMTKNVLLTTGKVNGTNYLSFPSSYAWVRKETGAVRRGNWRAAEGPIRFYLRDGPEVWRQHLTMYGLKYLK